MKIGVSRELYLKIAAVLLAIVIWFVAGADISKTQGDNIERFIITDVNVEGASPEFTVDTRPRQVEVRVRGPKYLVETLDGSKVQAYLSVSDRGEGEYAGRVEVLPPEGIQVIEVIPASVGVRVDTVVTEDFPVQIAITGYPAEATFPQEPELSPKFITVIGQKSQVEKISEVLARIDISGATSSISRNVKVSPIDAGGSVITDLNIQPQIVRVFVPIRKLPADPANAEGSGK
ncbi:MAG: hypothetical protein GX969_04365 [Firmicutes bacterium]|nr:hypothetical protein [Bacillota bacterium]